MIRQLMGKPPETTHFYRRWRRPATWGFANSTQATHVSSLTIVADGLHAKGRLSFKTDVFGAIALEKSFWSCPSFCPQSRRNATWCHLAALGSRRHRKLGATGVAEWQNRRHRTGITGIRATYVHDSPDSTHGALRHGCCLCARQRAAAHCSRHLRVAYF